MTKLLRTALLALVPTMLLVLLILVSLGALPYKVFAVRTGSMGPTIPSRSAVVIRSDTFRLGQVIAFHESGAVVTHRFVAENPDGTIVTKGDANITVDPWHTKKSDVIGGVVAAPRNAGYWLIFLRNPAGLLVILLAALAIAQIWMIARQVETHAPLVVSPA
jgi:signal peptidase